MITHTLDVTDGDTQVQVFALRWYHPPRPQAAKPPRQFELRPQDMRFWVASVMPAPKKEKRLWSFITISTYSCKSWQEKIVAR